MIAVKNKQKPRHRGFFSWGKMSISELTRKTVWICDRKKCANCSKECRHTSDPAHARDGAIDWRDAPHRFQYYDKTNTMWQIQ